MSNKPGYGACTRFSGVLFLALGMAAAAWADPAEPEQMRGVIKQQGGKWVAEETWISRLAPETRRNLLLAAPRARTLPPGTRLSFTPPTPPAAFDWRNVSNSSYLTSVKNQVGSTCVAYANTASLESCVLREMEPHLLRVLQQGGEIDLSEHALVSCNSGYPGSVDKFLMNTGLPTEACYPFSASAGQCATACSGWQGKTYRFVNHDYYKHLKIDEVKALLVQFGPLVTGINVPADFFTYKGGVYSTTLKTNQGFHEVLLVGYDDSNKCFIVKNSWGTNWGENGYFRIAYSEFESGDRGGTVDFGTLIDAYYGLVASIPVALKTADGHYLTVVNGGGLGGPGAGPNAVALHSDATREGAWETFQMEWSDPAHFALKTANGNYVTAINGGGMGGPSSAASPIHTDAVKLGAWEKLFLEYNTVTHRAALRTPNGQYLTAVNGGGFGGPNNVPIHTDAKRAGPWEMFSLEVLK